MTNEEAASVYQRLFVAFPQVREWLTKVDNPTATHAVWCGVLAGVEYDDAIAVVDSVISGSERGPEAYERERWPQFIRRGASEIRSRRNERRRMAKYHATATESATTDGRFMAAIREAWRVGNAKRDGYVTQAENVVMVEDLVEWSERDGQKPDWFGRDFTERMEA